LVIGCLPITAGALSIGFARRPVIASIQRVVGNLPIKFFA